MMRRFSSNSFSESGFSEMSAQQQREAFGVTLLTNSHKDIRRLRQQHGAPSIHGNKFWKSTYLLMDYLKEFPIPNGARVLELGCGWGIAGIYCAKHGAHVTGLDADPAVLPYFEHHAQLNEVSVATLCMRYEKLTKQILSEFDVVIAADICFWDEMVNPLYNLVRRCTQAGVQRIVMTDPARPPFSEMAERAVEKLGAELEVWSIPHPYNTSGLVMDWQID
ncbi:class I SAM-dependent methyltransferase [Marinibactrum halimedae]|uniref:Methyltransferase domain-containing protein n=1 Tax=Marinibactrum halimedae TaxID=1444977 RepID=A0AA37WNS6_9GAMM|nr:methyltransferase domain-containing protein [Marinibactrum halimedae]MCD9460642.1 methyltransferase domain-containing protein [Marinibactrum halimedae]GLS27858.1 hypothetical protein GCM10007877_35770 [Marinibactrum halimedae]